MTHPPAGPSSPPPPPGPKVTLKHPVRQHPQVAPDAGGPGPTLPVMAEGRHRLYGQVWEPPFPGSPPGPPPDPGPPPQASDSPDPKPIPPPQPYPPPR